MLKKILVIISILSMSLLWSEKKMHLIVNYEDEVYDAILHNSTDFLEVREINQINADTKEIIYSDDEETLYLFSRNREYLFFMRSVGEKNIIEEIIFFEYSILNAYFISDLDDDGVKEIVSMWGDESSYEVLVHKYERNINNLSCILEFELAYPVLMDTNVIYFLKNNRIYLLYGYSTPEREGQISKFGIIKYNECDFTKEIFFSPINEITLEEWLFLRE